MYFAPCWSSFFKKLWNAIERSHCHLDARLCVTWITSVRATCMMHDVDWPESKFSYTNWSLGFFWNRVQWKLERGDIILLRVVLLLRVRLYFLFGYVRSQKVVKISRQQRFSVKWGKEIWLELTRTQLEHKKENDIVSNQGTGQYIFRVILRIL